MFAFKQAEMGHPLLNLEMARHERSDFMENPMSMARHPMMGPNISAIGAKDRRTRGNPKSKKNNGRSKKFSKKAHASTLDSIEQDIFRLKAALHNTISKYDLDKNQKRSAKKSAKKSKPRRKPIRDENHPPTEKSRKNNKIVTINFDKTTTSKPSAKQAEKMKLQEKEKKISQSLSYLESRIL